MDELRPPHAIDPDPAYAACLEQLLIARFEATPTDREESHVMLDLAPSPQPVRRDRRTFMVAAIAACLAAIALAGILVARHDDARHSNAPKAIDVTFHLAWPDLQGLEQPRCLAPIEPFDSAVQHRCFRTFYGLASASGDVSGTALWTMVGSEGKAATPDDATVEIPAAFNGTYIVQATIPGCGRGEFMIAEQLRFDGWEAGAFSGTWQIIPGSGRGELAEVSGGGTVPGDHPDQNTTQDMRVGQFNCPPPTPSG